MKIEISNSYNQRSENSSHAIEEQNQANTHLFSKSNNQNQD